MSNLAPAEIIASLPDVLYVVVVDPPEVFAAVAPRPLRVEHEDAGVGRERRAAVILVGVDKRTKVHERPPCSGAVPGRHVGILAAKAARSAGGDVQGLAVGRGDGMVIAMSRIDVRAEVDRRLPDAVHL